MIDAGLPMVQCLDILGNQADNPTFKVLLDVKASVENGNLSQMRLRNTRRSSISFSEPSCCRGSRRYPDTIWYVWRRASRNPQTSISRSRVLKLSIWFRDFVGQAFFIFVIPSFKSMFEDMGQTPLWLTTQVIVISEYMQENIGTILISLAGLFLFGLVFEGSPGALGSG